VLFSIFFFFWNFLISKLWKPQKTPQETLLPGNRKPQFFQGTYHQAISEASKVEKFLLVYLHSSHHVNTPKFCNEVLYTEPVATFLEDHFVLWMADVQQPEGYKLTDNFGLTTYPFLAVVINITNYSSLAGYLQSLSYNRRITRNGLMLVSSKQGEMNARQLIEEMTRTLENHGALIQAIKSERKDREREREIIELQNRDYLVSLEKDKEKEKQKREEENRIRQEKERISQEAREREHQQEKAERKRQEKEEKNKLFLQNLSPEPDKSDQTTDVVIRLSNGERITRRFLGTDTLNYVISYVNAKGEDMDNKTLVTHYPKISFPDTTISLKDLNQFPKSVLFVEEMGLTSSNNRL
jgi:FAS-associated factor 2